MIVQQLALLRTKPFADGSAEAALGAIQQIAWQHVFKRAFQNVLAARAFDLQRARQRKRILDEFVIEKRHARFD